MLCEKNTMVVWLSSLSFIACVESSTAKRDAWPLSTNPPVTPSGDPPQPAAPGPTITSPPQPFPPTAPIPGDKTEGQSCQSMGGNSFAVTVPKEEKDPWTISYSTECSTTPFKEYANACRDGCRRSAEHNMRAGLETGLKDSTGKLVLVFGDRFSFDEKLIEQIPFNSSSYVSRDRARKVIKVTLKIPKNGIKPTPQFNRELTPGQTYPLHS